jgi:hypothetical protein
MKGIRLAAAVIVAGSVAIGAIGSAVAADKAKEPRYSVYKSDQGCSVVMNATKKTPGKKMASGFKSEANAQKRMAKLVAEKKC